MYSNDEDYEGHSFQIITMTEHFKKEDMKSGVNLGGAGRGEVEYH